jgi:hypothetical protein
LRFLLWGAAGFGLGGLLGGFILYDLLTLIASQRSLLAGEDQLVLASLAGCVAYAVMGAVGGVALGLAQRQVRAAVRLACTGLLAFGLGGLCNVLLAGVVHTDLSVAPPVALLAPGVRLLVVVLFLAAFGIRGAMGGALLGLAFPSRHSVRILSIAGFVGFALGGAVISCLLLLLDPERVLPVLHALGPRASYAVWLGLCAAVGGAIFSAVVAFLPPLQRAS